MVAEIIVPFMTTSSFMFDCTGLVVNVAYIDKEEGHTKPIKPYPTSNSSACGQRRV